jgi:hypothetical protein
MQTGSSGTLIGWKSGQTTFVPLWNQMEPNEGNVAMEMDSEVRLCETLNKKSSNPEICLYR